MTYPDPGVQEELTHWLRRSVDVDEERSLAVAFGVSALPTAVAIDGDGRVLVYVQGFVPPEEFRGRLEAARRRL